MQEFEKQMKAYDREIIRRLWRGRIRRIGRYIDDHAWTWWVCGGLYAVALDGLWELLGVMMEGGAR